MGYNPQNAKEQALLPPDSILEGQIADIKDGLVKDFVTNLEGWKGDADGKAINVQTAVRHEGNAITFWQIFTYREENGTTVFTPNSNIGKFNKKYGTLPTINTKVKVITDNDSFCKIKLD